MEEKLGAVLSNPQLMQQIMSMAQALGSQEQKQESPQPPAPKPQPQPVQQGFSLEGMDLGAIQRIAGLAQRSQIDQNQRSLLRALSPYLSKDRITKLEKAMRAAKIAAIAGVALNQGGFQFHPGR